MSADPSRSTVATTVQNYRWHDGVLESLNQRDPPELRCEVADSWLVRDGAALALDVHYDRFVSSILARGFDSAGAVALWHAAIDEIPRSGAWFPRVDLLSHDGAEQYQFRLRSAPELRKSIVLWSFVGDDPRTALTIKGPDLAAMARIRTDAHNHGADEAVLLSPEGFVIDGAHTALLWWRGDSLCAPDPALERVDSVTARSLLTLATVFGVPVQHENVTPADMDGLEIWAVNALHGIRIVTSWLDGPTTAEEPGRLAQWRRLMATLRKPLAPTVRVNA